MFRVLRGALNLNFDDFEDCTLITRAACNIIEFTSVFWRFSRQRVLVEPPFCPSADTLVCKL